MGDSFANILQLETRCGKCNGLGKIANLEFNKELDRLFPHLVSDCKEAYERVKASGLEENIECPSCGGIGSIPTEFGKQILEFIKRHGGEIN